MDFLLSYTDLPKLHIFVALLAGLLSGIFFPGKSFSRKTAVGLLVTWLILVLSSTVLSRMPFEGKHLELHLFWSYRAHSVTLLKEDFLNLFLLLPVGVLLPVAGVRRFRWVILFGFCATLCVETLQLLTQTGLFELDDIFHNTLGVAIGWLLWKYCDTQG